MLRSPRSLPVALRPFDDESLGSWLSRTGGVYDCSVADLLRDFNPCGRDQAVQLDLQPDCDLLGFVGNLLSTDISILKRCTLAQVYPEWLRGWIGRTPPEWHVTDRRTYDSSDVVPAICPLCLSSDLRAGRSQYIRLSWYCAVYTVCQIHRTPMVCCCSSALRHHHLVTQTVWPIHRACCLRCRRNLDCPQGWEAEVDQSAISALLTFESMLRNAINQPRRGLANASELGVSLGPIRDLAWALMRPVSGTSFRALHFLHLPQFRMPHGFNTPAEASNWLACGPIGVRRSILAVIASLILPASICQTLTHGVGRGLPFWTKLRSYHTPDTRREFERRAAKWSECDANALEFYR
jgi:TniQ